MATSKGQVRGWQPNVIGLVKWGTGIGGVFLVFYLLTCVMGLIISMTIFIFLCICLFFIYIFIFFVLKKDGFISIFFKTSLSIFMLWLLIFSFMYSIAWHDPMQGNRITRGITKEKIISLQPGMDKSDIIRILGEPFRTDNENRSLLSYYLGYFIKSKYIINGYLIYATSIILHGYDGFAFYVRITNNKLTGIYIKKNDFDIYSCSQRRCPNIINQKAFEEFLQLASQQSI